MGPTEPLLRLYKPEMGIMCFLHLCPGCGKAKCFGVMGIIRSLNSLLLNRLSSGINSITENLGHACVWGNIDLQQLVCCATVKELCTCFVLL